MGFGFDLPLPATADRPGQTAASWEWLRARGNPPSSKVNKESTGPANIKTARDKDSTSRNVNSEQEPWTKISESDVLEMVNMRERFRLPELAAGIEVTNLPNFEDITQYGVSEETQRHLWRREVVRLVEIVKDNSPLEFKGSKVMSSDSKTSYEIFAGLADRTWQAMNITQYDSENTSAAHNSQFCNVELLQKCRMNLDYICERDEDEDGFDQNENEEPLGSTEDLFDFISYCTAVIARIMCTAVIGNTFYIRFLAHLARISTKLKIVSVNPRECSQTSIENGVPDKKISVPHQPNIRGRQDNYGVSASSDAKSDLGVSLGSPPGTVPGTVGELGLEWEPLSKKQVLRRIYMLQCSKYNYGILSLLTPIMLSVRGGNQLIRKSISSYEICAMVYETGFERFRTLVFQDHDNDFQGTSDAAIMNHAGSVFHLLNETAHKVAENLRHSQVNVETPTDNGNHPDFPSQVNGNRGLQTDCVNTTIAWSFSTNMDLKQRVLVPKEILLKSMSNIISVAVPLIMTNPSAVQRISQFIDLATFTDHFGNEEEYLMKPRAYPAYIASCCLTTEAYKTNQSRRERDDPSSLSNALMRRNNLLSGKHIFDIGRVASFNRNASHKERFSDEAEIEPIVLEQIQRNQHELDKVRNIMKTWVFEEKGVMVRCKTYVSAVVFLCVLLVTGGVGIGVTVGERITAVDPFNVTTYCWVLAGFLLLLMKSIRVQNWPWNDFLHGRVLCKSVSELSSVTGIEEQLIMAKVLQDESTTILQTRGPYNTIFWRKSEDGFSIDRPLRLWTMLLSGLIMIEVETTRGRGLDIEAMMKKFSYIAVGFLIEGD